MQMTMQTCWLEKIGVFIHLHQANTCQLVQILQAQICIATIIIVIIVIVGSKTIH